MKKFLALLLALTMVLSLGTVAFAAKTAPVAGSNHTYKAYKIFDGTQAAGDAALANITWGNGIDSDGFLAALKADAKLKDTFKDCTDAASVAAAMKGDNWADKSDNAKAFAKLAENYVVKENGISVKQGDILDAGYYLVVDESASVDKEDAYNVALLQLTQKGQFDIEAKNEVPEVDKKIVEGENRVEANNASIGDTVPYEITSKIPAAADNYEYYFFIIRDTLSKGLTFQNDIKVYIGGELATVGEDYTVKTGKDAAPYTFQIALTDATAHAGQDVVVTYTAVLNNEAAVGVVGNPNTVNVIYSNNPNDDYDTKPTDDGFPKSEKDNPKGETPDEYTITYTTEVKVLKVDEKGNKLTGAEFQLTGEKMNTVLVWQEKFTEANDGTYYLLKDGTYTTKAPTENSYREATAADGRDGGYVLVNGEYKVATKEQLADENVKLYIFVEGTKDQYASTTTKYTKSSELVEKNSKDGVAVTASVNEEGYVVFTGLAAGKYTLKETQAPAGYQKLVNDINFTIAWEAPKDAKDIVSTTSPCTWTVGANSDEVVTYNATANQFEAKVVNTKAGELPETGGIGTTIFYVVGAVLVAAAGVLLITKKRMGAEG